MVNYYIYVTFNVMYVYINNSYITEVVWKVHKN